MTINFVSTPYSLSIIQHQRHMRCDLPRAATRSVGRLVAVLTAPSVRQAHGLCQKLHVGRGRAAGVREVVDEPRLGDLLLVEYAGGHVVLAFEVLDERVLGIESLGRALQRVPLQVELLDRMRSGSARLCRADRCEASQVRRVDRSAGRWRSARRSRIRIGPARLCRVAPQADPAREDLAYPKNGASASCR